VGFPEEHPETPAANKSIADIFQTRETINNSLLPVEPTAFFSEAKKICKKKRARNEEPGRQQVAKRPTANIG
jgi:hypothetical protein